MPPPFVHVAVDKPQLEGNIKCPPTVLPMIVALLEKLGPLTDHPGLMQSHALSSIGWYIDESQWEECNQRLVSGAGVQLVYKLRRFDVTGCEAWEGLTQAQRRQCVAVRGTNEIARRLDTHERGTAERRLCAHDVAEQVLHQIVHHENVAPIVARQPRQRR